MHDIRLIRENPESFDAALARRGLEPLASGLIVLDEERRALRQGSRVPKYSGAEVGLIFERCRATDRNVCFTAERQPV
jgi:seryl-tRNA synthetase